jgi:hypothetical protein
MQAKNMALVALIGIGIFASMPAAAESPLAVPNVVELSVQPSEDACANYTPVEGTELQSPLVPELTDEVITPASANPAAKPPKPCRACAAQPWCACTYNGHPRVSCDPCCYSTYTGEICTS